MHALGPGFFRSTRLLDGDRGRASALALLMAALLLGAWGAWFVLARVSLYELSRQARLEVEGSLALRAPADGQIRTIYSAPGQQVRNGDVLLVLAADSREYRLRASRAGRLDEMPPLHTGAFVRAGDWLGTVVPPGELRLVALFPSASALGRLFPGQPALVRLGVANLPASPQIPATVARVSSESQQGQVRVVFALHADPALAAELRHGMPGEVAVEVERVSPASLTLRALGRTLGGMRF
jgi:multidrug resistance efflux pump